MKEPNETGSRSLEIESLSVPLWAIAAGVNTGYGQTVCWIAAAALSVIILIKTTEAWKASKEQ